MIFPELLLPVNTLSSDVTGRDGKLMTCIQPLQKAIYLRDQAIIVYIYL